MKLGAISVNNICTKDSFKVLLTAVLGFIVSLSSSIAWKASDVDFAEKLGSGYLGKAYILSAVVLFIGAMSFVFSFKKKSANEIFCNFQKYALFVFGSVGLVETLFHISQYKEVIFLLKVLGYVYSCLIINIFWLMLNPYKKNSRITATQYTLYILSIYFGMTFAGLLLQTCISGTHQLGLCVAGGSTICWLLEKYVCEATEEPLVENGKTNSSGCLDAKTFSSSQTIIMLVIGSLLLNILISSTEYNVISNFENRFSLSAVSNGGNKTLGSFVALTGIGNIAALLSSRLVYHYYLGRGGIALTAFFSSLVLYFGFSDGNSLLVSGLALVITESLYPLVVESNLSRILEYFPDSKQLVTRALMAAFTEPIGLLLSALLLTMSWVSICTLGACVIALSFLLYIYSYTVEKKWVEFFAKLRQKKYIFAARLSTFLMLCQVTLPQTDQPKENSEVQITHDSK